MPNLVRSNFPFTTGGGGGGRAGKFLVRTSVMSNLLIGGRDTKNLNLMA